MIDAEKLFGTPDYNKILKAISRSGAPNILCSLEKGPKKFSQLMFEAKLNPGVLDRNLKALIELEIIEKREGRYILTDRGKEIVVFIKKLTNLFSNHKI